MKIEQITHRVSKYARNKISTYIRRSVLRVHNRVALASEGTAAQRASQRLDNLAWCLGRALIESVEVVELSDLILDLSVVALCLFVRWPVKPLDALDTLTLHDRLNVKDTLDSSLGTDPLLSPVLCFKVAKLHTNEHHEAIDGLSGSGVGDHRVASLSDHVLVHAIGIKDTTHGLLEALNVGLSLAESRDLGDVQDTTESAQSSGSLFSDSGSQIDDGIRERILRHDRAGFATAAHVSSLSEGWLPNLLSLLGIRQRLRGPGFLCLASR